MTAANKLSDVVPCKVGYLPASEGLESDRLLEGNLKDIFCS